MSPPEYCPNCGTEVPPRARACPECGADETAGWNDRATSQRLDLPDDDFDYGEFVREEFGPPRRKRLHWIWIVAALAVLGAFMWVFVPR